MEDKGGGVVVRWWAAALAYMVVTAVFFSNLLITFATHIYADLADTLLNASIIAWNAKVLPLTDEWWNYPAFAPLSGVTAFTEHLLVTYPVASPLVWLTGNPVLAYNIVFLLAFMLNGMTAYALGRELTGSSAAAFITGLAFAFSPYQSTQLSHLQMLLAFGMPLALLGLHRYIEHARRSGLVYLAVGCLITAFANAYVLLFFPVFVVLWSVWFVRPREWRRLVAPLVTAAAAMAPAAPLLWGYHSRQVAYDFSRSYYEASIFGADMTALTWISHRQLLWHSWLPWTTFEGALFPGVVVLGLTVAAVVHVEARGHSLGRWNRTLFKAAALTMVIGLVRLWTGPWGWHIGPIPLPAVQPYQLFTLTLLCLMIRLVLTVRFRYGWTTRNRLMFYVAAAVATWLLALGPEPVFAGVRAIFGPYRLLLVLPGFDGVRVPARMWLLGVLCLAVAAGFGARIVMQRWPDRQRWLLALMAVAIAAEGGFYDATWEAPRGLATGIIPAGAQVLDLPSEGGWKETPAEYRAVLGGYRVLNGYSGYEAPHFTPFRRALADYNVDALDAYRTRDDLYVIIRPGEDRFAGWITGQHGAERLFFTRDLQIYRLPHIGTGPRVQVPLPLPQSGRPAWVVP